MPENAVANRRAALLAHALPVTDRAWLLSELRPDQRETIASLLDELRSMRVPPDPELVRELLDAESRGGHEHFLQRLAADDLAPLVEVLRAEPARLVASFLQARAWPWREQVLHQLGTLVADCMRDRRASPRAGRLEDSLVEAVAQALQARAAPSRKRVAWLKSWRGGLAK